MPRHDAGNGERIARRAGNRRDDRAARADDAVEERGLPDIRASDQHDRWEFSGIHGQLNDHLASALTA